MINNIQCPDNPHITHKTTLIDRTGGGPPLVDEIEHEVYASCGILPIALGLSQAYKIPKKELGFDKLEVKPKERVALLAELTFNKALVCDILIPMLKSLSTHVQKIQADVNECHQRIMSITQEYNPHIIENSDGFCRVSPALGLSQIRKISTQKVTPIFPSIPNKSLVCDILIPMLKALSTHVQKIQADVNECHQRIMSITQEYSPYIIEHGDGFWQVSPALGLPQTCEISTPKVDIGRLEVDLKERAVLIIELTFNKTLVCDVLFPMLKALSIHIQKIQADVTEYHQRIKCIIEEEKLDVDK